MKYRFCRFLTYTVWIVRAFSKGRFFFFKESTLSISEKAISARIISRWFTLAVSHCLEKKCGATLPISSVFHARFLQAAYLFVRTSTPGGRALLRNYRHCHARLDLFCLFGGKVLSFAWSDAGREEHVKTMEKEKRTDCRMNRDDADRAHCSSSSASDTKALNSTMRPPKEDNSLDFR